MSKSIEMSIQQQYSQESDANRWQVVFAHDEYN